jgi:hypothetical protein
MHTLTSQQHSEPAGVLHQVGKCARVFDLASLGQALGLWCRYQWWRSFGLPTLLGVAMRIDVALFLVRLTVTVVGRERDRRASS